MDGSKCRQRTRSIDYSCEDDQQKKAFDVFFGVCGVGNVENSSQCQEERSVLVQDCYLVVTGSPPSPSCCIRIRVTHLECVCPLVTPALAAQIGVDRAVKAKMDIECDRFKGWTCWLIERVLPELSFYPSSIFLDSLNCYCVCNGQKAVVVVAVAVAADITVLEVFQSLLPTIPAQLHHRVIGVSSLPKYHG
ncbi:hypothetical protein ACLOJK_016810 [Asimina triloba]